MADDETTTDAAVTDAAVETDDPYAQGDVEPTAFDEAQQVPTPVPPEPGAEVTPEEAEEAPEPTEFDLAQQEPTAAEPPIGEGPPGSIGVPAESAVAPVAEGEE